MNDKTRKLVRDVTFTTCLSFLCITFLYIGMIALFSQGQDGGEQTLFQFFSYVFQKLFLCVFPFSLCLGFANRIIEGNRGRALRRLIHFFITFAAYFIFMDLVFNLMLEDGEVPIGQIIRHTIPFFVFYPLTVGVNALGRSLFLPKESKEVRSILD